MASNFDDMPTLRSSPTSSSPSSRSRHKSWARRLERCCCRALGYFPLVFVYGLTGWAVWVAVHVSFDKSSGIPAYTKAAIVVLLYVLANVSYTIAVFTSPGSPLDERVDLGHRFGSKARGNYNELPTYESYDRGSDFDSRQLGPMTTVTAKSSGQPRYCKKCRSVKPDRTHHCSTCGRCVLKMDHHCPWLATCVGLRNYKAFMLFLIYTSAFCWACFLYSAAWVWAEIADDVQMEEGIQVVNTILLAVLGGVIGLVLTGFTGWHLYLTFTGQTTIESLEKTRYLAPLQKSLELDKQTERRYLVDEPDAQTGLRSLGNQLKELHANALPGVLRAEEGEAEEDLPAKPRQTPPSSAREHLMRSYASLEAQREHDRYNSYLDERDSERLPNAFNLGWRRNFTHVFGERTALWFVPILNSPGDGWQWEISDAWRSAQSAAAQQRVLRNDRDGSSTPLRDSRPPPPPKWQVSRGQFTQHETRSESRGQSTSHGDTLRMQNLDRHNEQGRDLSSLGSGESSDDNHPDSRTVSDNWNDIPDEYLRAAPGTAHGQRGRSLAQSGKGKGD